jgi:predicted RNA binding protein YcfA (HicA-like mRNA interferase family)
MPKLYSSRKVVAVLEKNGFVFVSQKGSHAKYRKITGSRVLTTIVSMAQREIFYGTFRAILEQTGIDEKEFKK